MKLYLSILEILQGEGGTVKAQHLSYPKSGYMFIPLKKTSENISPEKKSLVVITYEPAGSEKKYQEL